MRLTAIASACLLLGGAGMFYFVRWRANHWDPNEGNRSERRALGRKLAVVIEESSPEDLENLLAAATEEQHRQLEREYASHPKLLTAVFALVAVVGVGFFLSETPLIASAFQTSRWPAVRGKLQSAAVQSEKRGKHTYYFPVVSYDYEVQGVAYHGARYALEKDDSLSHDSANVSVQKLLAAPDALVVYYDPQSPNESLLKPGLPLFKALAIVVFAGLAIGGGAFAIRSYYKSRQPFQADEIEIALP
jgi:hypothetical protein